MKVLKEIQERFVVKIEELQESFDVKKLDLKWIIDIIYIIVKNVKFGALIWVCKVLRGMTAIIATSATFV